MNGKDGRKSGYLFKIIIIGDSGVGKTNLITRFCENHFKQTYVATIGVDFKIKSLVLDGKKMKMQIWDTAGQQRFKNITQTYYKGAAGIILTYSLIDHTSFANVERWMNQIEANAPENVTKVLIGTKQDLAGERSVSYEEGKELAKKYNISFMESSAKTGYQVKEAFEILAKEVFAKFEEEDENQYGCEGEFLKGRQKQEKKSCGC